MATQKNLVNDALPPEKFARTVYNNKVGWAHQTQPPKVKASVRDSAFATVILYAVSTLVNLPLLAVCIGIFSLIKFRGFRTDFTLLAVIAYGVMSLLGLMTYVYVFALAYGFFAILHARMNKPPQKESN